MVSPELRAQLEALHRDSFAWALTCCRGNHADAEDVLQNVYVQIFDGRARFHGHSELKTWLFSVIRNQAAKEMRRQILGRLIPLRRLFGANDSVDPMQPDTQLRRTEDEGAFEQALNALPTRQSEVLHLVFYEDLTIDSAARIMGISVGSARQHYERGKAKLRKSAQKGDLPT